MRSILRWCLLVLWLAPISVGCVLDPAPADYDKAADGFRLEGPRRAIAMSTDGEIAVHLRPLITFESEEEGYWVYEPVLRIGFGATKLDRGEGLAPVPANFRLEWAAGDVAPTPITCGADQLENAVEAYVDLERGGVCLQPSGGEKQWFTFEQCGIAIPEGELVTIYFWPFPVLPEGETLERAGTFEFNLDAAEIPSAPPPAPQTSDGVEDE